LFYLEDSARGDMRSRLCEQVWLEADLFGIGDEGLIYAVVEEAYGEGGSNAEKLLGPGRAGEQLLLRELRWERVCTGQVWYVADARLEVVRVGELVVGAGAAVMRAVQLKIVEDGLVEPGAVVCGG
jgi:hypothetical protein